MLPGLLVLLVLVVLVLLGALGLGLVPSVAEVSSTSAKLVRCTVQHSLVVAFQVMPTEFIATLPAVSSSDAHLTAALVSGLSTMQIGS